MKQFNRILWGVILVALGVVFALNALEITDITVFFDGWWTLFIIIPCGVGLFTERDKTGNLIGLAIGGCLLLACQGILTFALLWKLLVPAVILVIGLRLVLGGLFGRKAAQVAEKNQTAGVEPRVGFAAFSGCNMRPDGELFEGAQLTAVFGGVQCDLRGAVIEKDCVVEVTAVFGGITILLPPGVNVRSSAICLFGGVSDKTVKYPQSPVTVYITGTCLFGGVDIK